MNTKNNGITRKEAFTKILKILEDCDAITYSEWGNFTKDNFLSALINTETKKCPTWENLGYSNKTGFINIIKTKIDISIINKKIGNDWDKYLLYLIDYRYCPKCKLCYKLEHFSKRKDIKTTYCKLCSTNISKQHYDTFRYESKEDMNNKRKKTVFHIINVMIREGKLPECSICGYKKNWSALDFHHIDNSIQRPKWAKNSNPGHYILGCIAELAEERYLAEIDNLELLCANCHRETHNPQWDYFLE